MYTINHVQESFIKNAHYTSAKFETGVSEFERCRLNEEYLFGFKPPFVKESKLKLGMKFCELIPISINNTALVVGEIQHLIIPEDAVNTNGHIDLEISQSIGISGLNSYYQLRKLAQYPYARVGELPDFHEDE